MNSVAYFLVGLGVLFDFFGTLGLVRLPDVYNRLQASTKCVTLGTCMILIGVAVGNPTSAFVVRAVICGVFILLTSPVGAHALARGSRLGGFKLWEKSVVDKYGESLQEVGQESDAGGDEAA